MKGDMQISGSTINQLQHTHLNIICDQQKEDSHLPQTLQQVVLPLVEQCLD